jgi:hypothetical protein
MKLDIENSEELKIAKEAVERFRQTQVRHVGKHAGRMKYQCHSSDRERAFANGWAKQNERVAYLNGNRGLLEILLCTDPKEDRVERELTPAEATAAATAIQWLGTHCGFCFLEKCLGDAGYSVIHRGRNAEQTN